jgi:hypothetical protein
MKRSYVTGFVLLLAVTLVATPARAQEQIYLRGVEPARGRPGEELELALVGGGFGGEVRVAIGGFDVLDAWVESEQVIRARVRIPEDAPPGPRNVEVTVIMGQNEEFRAMLEGGFTVLEAGPRPTEAPAVGPPLRPEPIEPGSTGGGDGNLDWLLWVAGLLLSGLLGGGIGGGLGFALGRSMALKTQVSWKKAAQLQWEVEAKKELPQPKQACTWDCRARAKADLLDRWHVTALTLTPLPLPSGRTPPTKRVAGEAVAPLNEAVRHRLEGADETRRRLAPVVDALLAQIQLWTAEVQTPASIRVDAEVKGAVECEFALCHCEQRGAGLEWIERLKWKRTLRQPCGESLGILRGPAADEPDFAARVRGELEAQLLALVRSVRWKL